MKADESSAAFVVRVEQQRKVLKMDPVATYHAFIQKLDLPLRRKLETVRITKKA